MRTAEQMERDAQLDAEREFQEQGSAAAKSEAQSPDSDVIARPPAGYNFAILREYDVTSEQMVDKLRAGMGIPVPSNIKGAANVCRWLRESHQFFTRAIAAADTLIQAPLNVLVLDVAVIENGVEVAANAVTVDGVVGLDHRNHVGNGRARAHAFTTSHVRHTPISVPSTIA